MNTALKSAMASNLPAFVSFASSKQVNHVFPHWRATIVYHVLSISFPTTLIFLTIKASEML